MRKIFSKLEIINKLKDHFGFKNDSEFADFLGIAPQTLSSWKARNSIDYDLVYAKCVGIDANWLLTGKGTMLKGDIHNNIEAIAYPSGNGIPLVEPIVVGGFGNSQFSIKESDVKEYYVVPKFKDRRIDFMIEVAGASMYPKYASGDIVACTIIRESHFIQWGKVYVISTQEQGLLIKRLYPCENKEKDCIECHSDNEKYPPFEIYKNEIMGLALVVGVIRLE